MGRSTGSWLSGPQAASDDDGRGSYPGEDLGLPQRGPGSVSPLSRRLAAFAVDSVVTDVVTLAIFHKVQPWSLPVLFVIYVVGTSLVAQTPGMAVLGLRIASVDRARVSVGGAAVRTLLLCLLIPALFTDHNVRGLHDRASGAVVVRR